MGQKVSRYWFAMVVAAACVAACSVPTGSSTDNFRGGFKDVAVRDAGIADDGGRLLELSAKSVRPLTLLEAQTNLEIDARCGDGRRYQLEWRSPVVGAMTAVADVSKSWPARTLFDVEVHCERPLPNEFVAGADVDMRMLELLPVDTHLMTQGRAHRFVFPIRYWDSDHGLDREKYDAYSEFVGEQTRDMFLKCGGPVVVRGLAATAGAPIRDASTDSAQGEILAGISLECLDRDTADAQAP